MTYEGEVIGVERVQHYDGKNKGIHDLHVVRVTVSNQMYSMIDDYFTVALPGNVALGTKYNVTFEKKITTLEDLADRTDKRIQECSEAVDKVTV